MFGLGSLLSPIAVGANAVVDAVRVTLLSALENVYGLAIVAINVLIGG